MTEQPKPGHFHVVPDVLDVPCDRCGEYVPLVLHEVQNEALTLYWNICPMCSLQIAYADATREEETNA